MKEVTVHMDNGTRWKTAVGNNDTDTVIKNYFVGSSFTKRGEDSAVCVKVDIGGAPKQGARLCFEKMLFTGE